jgi:hypothetical protein
MNSSKDGELDHVSRRNTYIHLLLLRFHQLYRKYMYAYSNAAYLSSISSRQGMKRAWTILSDIPMWCQFIKREEQINPEKFIQFGHEKKLYTIKMLPPRLI